MADKLEIRDNICAFAKAHGFPDIRSDDMELLALGGSDRRFYRLRASGRSCIAMISAPPGDEQRAWMDIHRFLNSCTINVPELYAVDNNQHMVLVQDAGDVSMYHALHAATDRQSVLKLYKQALFFLAEMQVRATPRMQSCACLSTRRFNYAAFRYETDYFVRSFLQEYCGMDKPSGLDEEFHHLAEILAAEPVVFMHRDFQSQNLHMVDGRILVIDFQTATAGPPHYDLVSLLKDAYFVLNTHERELLLQDYFDARCKLGSPIKNQSAFIHTFHMCGLQRNMQALAAFAFLGTHKKKTHFFAHIPTALNYLAEALNTRSDFTHLQRTINLCRKSSCTIYPPNQPK
jgi:N-acetylmuramate 1-kinase